MISPQVQAAGGVVLRPDGDDHEVLVVHRPGHEDWSLPKGKLDGDETFRAAASREVTEETGVVPILGRELTSVRYRDRHDRPKIVRYWRMSVHREIDWEPDDEVGEAVWWSTRRAMKKLTYGHDRDLVQQALRTPATTRLAVVRHAHAGKRSAWDGDDELRPLSKLGRRQSRRLVKTFRRRRVTSLTTSPLRRCQQTLRPLGDGLRMRVDADDRLREDASLTDLLDVVASTGDGGVLCSHGAEIGLLLEELAERSSAFPTQLRKQKGSVWWLEIGPGLVAEKATYRGPAT